MSKVRKKHYSLNKLIDIIRTLKDQGKRIAFTNGCFDILHVGHIYNLKKASSLGDVLIVGVNSDSSVKKLKGIDRPIIPLKERIEILGALEMVDFVVQFGEKTPIKLIKLIKPDILVKGGDYTKDDIVGADFVKRSGGRIVVIPLIKGKSSTSIVKKIKAFE